MSEEIKQIATLEEIFKSNFSLFDSCAVDIRAEQIKKINFIEVMERDLEKNLKDVNLFDIIKNEDKLFTATDPEIIDALIAFDRGKYFVTEEIKREDVVLSDDQIKVIEKAYKDNMQTAIVNLERNIESNLDYAISSLTDHQNYMRQVSESRNKIEQLGPVDYLPFVKMINEKVLIDPKYSFSGFWNGQMEFTINEDIICTHKNSRAGIDIRVNLGRMKFRLSYSNGIGLEVHKHKDNITSSGYYHPHISSGNICLGNMNDLFNEAMEKKDIHQMFEITRSILLTYNDGDPYRALHYFASASGQIQPNGESSHEEDHYETHSCYECESDIEVVFEEGNTYENVECAECGYENEFERYD